MRLQVETSAEQQKILIVAHNHYSFIDLLKSELHRYGGTVFFSPRIPQDLDRYHACFFINITHIPQRVFAKKHMKIALIFYNKKGIAAQQVYLPRVKIIEIKGHEVKQSLIDSLLWFFFSTSSEKVLTLTAPSQKRYPSPPHFSNLQLGALFSRRRIVSLILIIIFIIQFGFLPFLLVSFYFSYRSAQHLQNNNILLTKNTLTTGSFFLNAGKKMYAFARPTLLFFSLALFPDNLFEINEKANVVLKHSISLTENSQQTVKMLFQKDKSPQETAFLSLRLQRLTDDVSIIEENLVSLNQKIPNSSFLTPTRKKISELSEIVFHIKKILPSFTKIFGIDEEKKYLLLFANNMELRPGGGFIGSFGVLTLKNLSISDLQIFDVYDADGQLIAHVDPPEPIRTYLQQPHWFLRDSAFSPDFLANYAQAKFFLEKEIGAKGFAGSILITTTAIQNILSAFPPLFIPDFNETVNEKNFYLKAQLYAEKNFFPGSIQKKSFLSSLARQMLISAENVSSAKLAKQLKKSLDEKQIVLYLDDTDIQKTVDSFYWSGRLIDPQCPKQTKNCINDFLFPIDANLGVNKANFFITRLINLKIFIDKNGKINHHLSIQFKNEAPSDVFPGGSYHNYFQLLMPVNSVIRSVTKDGVLVDQYDEKNDQFKTVGFFFTLPPRRTTEVKLDYSIEHSLAEGTNIYQSIVQKQIGSANNDLVLEVNLDKNISLINQNFSPLVKDNQILYNTNLSADKIFFIELVKQ